MTAALSIRNLVKEYVRGKRVLDGITLDIRARGPHRGHRPLRHRQVDAASLHQPPGRARPRARSSSAASDIAKLARQGAAPGAPPDRHGVPGIQPRGAPDRDGEPALRAAWATCRPFKAWLRRFPQARHRPRVRAARPGGARGLRQPARRRALRRPAPARGHRARGDAAAASCCSPTSRPRRSIRRPRSRSWSSCATSAASTASR